MNDHLHLNPTLFEYFTEIEKERIQRDVAHKNWQQPTSKKHRKTMLEIILNND